MSYYDFDEDYDIFEDYDFDEDYGVKKKGKGKLIAIILASVLSVAAVVGVSAVIFKKHKEESVPVLVQEGLVMKESPEIMLGTPTGLRFKANVTAELKKEVKKDSNKSFGMVMAPVTSFIAVDTGDTPYETDWMAAFEEQDVEYYSSEGVDAITKSYADGTVIEHFIQCGLAETSYHKTNVEYVAIAYVKTMDGQNASYKYATFPDGMSYKTQGRSLAYLAAEKLNERSVNYSYYSSSDVTFLRTTINNSVDNANKLTAPTQDNSKYSVTLSETEATMKLGKELTLTATIAEKVKLPIWWTTSDETVVTVKNGVVTATGVGSARITAHVAGEQYSCWITVKKATDTNTQNTTKQVEVEE